VKHQRIAALVVGVLLFAIGFIPLFGGPGYEHSLASGLLVPSVAAIATSLELRAFDRPSPLGCVGRGIASGLFLSAVSFLTALVHGARVGLCDLWGGALGFLLTAGFGAVMGGVWGACVAELVRGTRLRRRSTVALALFAPLLGIAISLGRFYASPIIFAFDPFFGFFSGTLYDTVVDAGTPLFTYRAGSLATLLAVVFAASVSTRDPHGRLRFVSLSGDAGARVRAFLALVAAALSLGVTLRGADLGHWSTPDSLAEALGATRSGERCDVVLPDSTLPEDARLVVKDCDEEIRAVEAELGAKGPDRVRAFFFRDAGEKKRLMGAGDTYIAKPWRREVYLQMSGYPHPVLGHELAHVIAGSFGRGPFRIAGKLGGLWPNPGLIEGVAVAASPDDDALTDLQWVHAMMDLGTLPPVETVFSVDFLGAPASKAYTIAGAFVRWVLGRYGAEAVRAWYGGGSLPALTGRSWSELDLDFRKEASAAALSPDASAYAKAKFEHAAIFGRRCPHVVDGLRQHADQCRDAHEVDRAVDLYDQVLERDPHDWAARYSRAVTELRFGSRLDGRRDLRLLLDDPDEPRTWKDRTLDALTDDTLLHGDPAVAGVIFQSIADRTVDEDYARMEEVKSLTASDPGGRLAILALLVGGPHKAPDPVLAASLLGAWEDRTGSPIASFLLGKNLSQRGWRVEGAAHLDRVLAAPERPGGVYPTARVGREAVRDRAIDACALGDGEAVARLRRLVLDEKGPFAEGGGRTASVLRLLARCQVRRRE
jgi:hypothetical protein